MGEREGSPAAAIGEDRALCLPTVRRKEIGKQAGHGPWRPALPEAASWPPRHSDQSLRPGSPGERQEQVAC